MKIVKLSRSTYYYNLANRDKEKQKPAGKPAPGYSYDFDCNKICDAQIKDWIIEAINGDAEFYGYRKIKEHLKREYKLKLNHKKAYRLCKELGVLKPQRKIKNKVKKSIAINRFVNSSNTVWELDIKYGYIHKEDRFFFLLNVIDVFDRTLIDYHMGLSCDAKDTAATLRRCLIKRNLFNEDSSFPVVRTDNGPQFISHIFKETCESLEIHHERIPVRTPNKNAHIESFQRILEDECFSVNEFESYKDAYVSVDEFMERYNKRRIHSSLGYMTPEEFYNLYSGETLEWMTVKL